LGQSRLAVQRITDVMVGDGLLVYTRNPKHKKSARVNLSEKGRLAYIALREVQDPWAIDSTEDVSQEDLEVALQTVRRLIQKFDR
ncbi:MAG: hypothetical protein WD180_11420, partial [Pseudohongiellaceae bacterium]